MKKSVFLTVGLLFFCHGTLSMADEKPGHFKGKPSETLEQAVSNFSEYNHKLETFLKKDTLSPQEMQQVHELTYTLENAIEQMNISLAQLAMTLEAVHVGSETGDVESVKTQGLHYLDIARQFIKKAN